MHVALLKHAIAYPASWFYYGVGHLCSLILNWLDSDAWVAFWYPLYNSAMIKSSMIQDWARGQKHYPWVATCE